jgi:hypothetical protein
MNSLSLLSPLQCASAMRSALRKQTQSAEVRAEARAEERAVEGTIAPTGGMGVRAQTASQSAFRRRPFHARQRMVWACTHAHARGPVRVGGAHAPCLPHFQRCVRYRLFFAVPRTTTTLRPGEGAAPPLRIPLHVVRARLGFGPAETQPGGGVLARRRARNDRMGVTGRQHQRTC